MDSVNKWLTLMANLGVIAGIVFLVVEIRQNNVQLAAQARNSMFEARSEYDRDTISNNGGIAEIEQKETRGETLTDTETRRLQSRRFLRLRTFEFMFQENPEAVLQQLQYLRNIKIST